MKHTFSVITVLSFLIISCAQNSSTTEKEYIKNFEEKNKALEKELQEVKEKSETKNISQSPQREQSNPKNYFTIGSTETEVLQVMGDPTKYLDMQSAGKRLYYGMSVVVFEKGKVVSYDNFDKNLKVRVK